MCRENKIIVNIVILTEKLNFSPNKTVLYVEIFLWDVLPMCYQEKKRGGAEASTRAFSKSKRRKIVMENTSSLNKRWKMSHQIGKDTEA